MVAGGEGPRGLNGVWPRARAVGIERSRAETSSRASETTTAMKLTEFSRKQTPMPPTARLGRVPLAR